MKLVEGNHYKCKVIKIIKIGAIVELEDHSTELIHLSKIANCFISDVGLFLKVGDELDALGVSGSKRPVELSIKHMGITPRYEISSDEEEEMSFEEMLNRSEIRVTDKFDGDANYEYYHKKRKYDKKQFKNKEKYQRRFDEWLHTEF